MTGWRSAGCARQRRSSGHREGPPVRDHVGPTVAQDAALAALRRRARGPGDGRRVRPAAAAGRRPEPIGLPTFEPRGAFYAFPRISVTGLTSDVSPSVCSPRSAWRWCRATRSGRRAPASDVHATCTAQALVGSPVRGRRRSATVTAAGRVGRLDPGPAVPVAPPDDGRTGAAPVTPRRSGRAPVGVTFVTSSSAAGRAPCRHRTVTPDWPRPPGGGEP
jgi:hypothetical protein